MDLFGQDDASTGRDGGSQPPLAARMRPRTLDMIAGQSHILAEGCLMRRAVEADRLGSVILYGPPGCGKTSLAEAIAAVTRRRFERVSGVLSNVAELRAVMQKAAHNNRTDGTGTILFIDEIHRFSKSQQDVLLPYVEDGTVTLIGATTHNPMFFINSPLTSRSLVFELKPLTEDVLFGILQRALTAPEGFGALSVAAEDAALMHLAVTAEGDARRALNALELAVLTTPPEPDGTIRLTRAAAESSIQKKAVVYDHDEDGHYDTISAFIKSVRGSDPHAAVYWLAKMLYAGEDPRFIARRLVILASEDIGNADPRGLTVAVATFQSVDFVGMPEARLVLAQATTYLATAPKSNASYTAIEAAWADVEQGRTLPVPEHLKNIRLRAVGKSEGEAYRYPHDYAGGLVEQAYVPTEARYYAPREAGYEEVLARRMAQRERALADDTGRAGGRS